MKNINHYMLPRLTEDLYVKEGRSSIALSKEVANKINELVDAYNNLYMERLTKIQEQDGKIQGGILYMKDNLANTIHDMLELMKSNGDFNSIIRDVVEPNIANLMMKTDGVVSVKSYGAVGDGIHDDTESIQKAIDYAYSHNKTVQLPAGNFKITKTLKVYEHQEITGISRLHTIITAEGCEKAIEFIRSDDYVFDYTEGQKIRNLCIDCVDGGYGIYSVLSCPYIEIDNVNINNSTTGIHLNKGCWVASLSHINIWKCETGVYIGASGTSTKLEHIYVMYATKVAYDIVGLTYSEWDNVCADWCTGTVYKFNFCTININGLGCECIDAKTALELNNSRITINSGYIFGLVNESSTYVVGNASQLLIENSSIGGNAESKGKFCESRVKFDIELKNCKLNNIEGVSTSGYAFNTTTWNTGRSFYHTTLDDKFSYIGKATNDGNDPHKVGYDIPMPTIFGNVLGDVLVGENIDNRQWKQVKRAGDIFINQAPNNHIAFYQQITDTEMYYSKGLITGVSGNVITVSSVSLGSMAVKRGTSIEVGGSLYNESGDSTTITSVNIEGCTITVEDGSIFNLNEHFYYKPNIAFMKDAKYKAVQHITVGTNAERPSDAPIGFMYFDVSIMKPIWKTSTRWIDATGSEV